MTRVAPFRGLRYATSSSLDDFLCPPYDVISESEAEAFREKSPYNAIHLELPGKGDGDPYEAARRVASCWVSSGILTRESADAFYLYRMTTLGKGVEPRYGLVAALRVYPEAEGVFPHERTTPKDKSDRYALLAATHLNTSPIWVLADSPGLGDVLRATWTKAADAPAAGRLGHVIHEIVPITDPALVEALRDCVETAPLILADGHHRFETARKFAGDSGIEGARYVMAYVVELGARDIAVEPVPRYLPEASLEEVLAALAEIGPAERIDTVPSSPPALGRAKVMVVGREGAAVVDVSSLSHERALDVEVLDAALKQATARSGGDEWTYPAGYASGLELVSCAGGVLVMSDPPTLDQIRQRALSGELMPPKSTLFVPKPATGLVFRALY